MHTKVLLWVVAGALVPACGGTPTEPSVPSVADPAVHDAGHRDEGAPVDSPVDPTAIAEIGVGSYHGCFRRNNGTVTCWGSNATGQHGTDVPREPGAHVIQGVAKATSLSVGSYHSCAIVGDGAVWCWGTNLAGQLGNGRTGGPEGASEVAGLSDATQIAAGSSHTCALTARGEVHCWGSNSSGELAAKSSKHYPSPQRVAQLEAVEQIAAGDSHSCALVRGGEVYCWGANDRGQLGRKSLRDRTPALVPDIDGAIELTAGGGQSCARFEDGTARCWGAPSRGSPAQTQPQAVDGIGKIQQVELATSFACARTSDGQLWCWGENYNGQLGDGSRANSNEPVRVRLPAADDIALGGSFGCALAGGQIYCWGDNLRGQLEGRADGRPAPIAVEKLSDVTQLVASGHTTCAIHRDKTVSCWGHELLREPKVVAPTAVENLTGVEDLVLSAVHGCALLADGAVRCFGSNREGQLGDGTTNDSRKAVPVSSLAGVTKLVAGGAFTCAIVNKGRVKCWGAVGGGLLGVRSKKRGDSVVTAPKKVRGLDGAVDLAAAGDDACALLPKGRVVCWGRHRSKGTKCHIGPTDRTVCTDPPSPKPARLKGVSNVERIVLGGSGSSSGWLYAAGGVEYRLRLDREPVKSAPPLHYQGGTEPSRYRVGARAVKVRDKRKRRGQDGPCSLSGDRKVLCSGSNEYGEVGVGTFEPVRKPTAVSGLESVKQVVTGRRHACALLEDGTVQCWGNNTYGQLGPDDATNLGIPGRLTITPQ